VAYVFLHLLPEIAEGNKAIGEALSDVLRPTPLADLGIFLVALAGFTAFYGLERLADRNSERAAAGPSSGGTSSVAVEGLAVRQRRNPLGCTGCTWGRSWSTTR